MLPLAPMPLLASNRAAMDTLTSTGLSALNPSKNANPTARIQSAFGNMKEVTKACVSMLGGAIVGLAVAGMTVGLTIATGGVAVGVGVAAGAIFYGINQYMDMRTSRAEEKHNAPSETTPLINKNEEVMTDISSSHATPCYPVFPVKEIVLDNRLWQPKSAVPTSELETIFAELEDLGGELPQDLSNQDPEFIIENMDRILDQIEASRNEPSKESIKQEQEQSTVYYSTYSRPMPEDNLDSFPYDPFPYDEDDNTSFKSWPSDEQDFSDYW